MKEAKCPDCGEWSDVRWVYELPPGGFWWAGDEGGGGCPQCGALVCVESECDFREKTTAIVIGDPIDKSKIGAAFLGIALGDPTGVALIVAASEERPLLIWSGQGPSATTPGEYVFTEANTRAMKAGAAIPPMVVIGAPDSDLDWPEMVCADNWRHIAVDTGWPLLGKDGEGFRRSAWRDILGGPAPDSFHPARWQRWYVVLAETIFGLPASPAQPAKAEAILIALASMIAFCGSRTLARWAVTLGQQETRRVESEGAAR